MKKISLLMICFCFVALGNALAEIDLQRHTGELGTEISYIRYKEPGVMEEKGMMWGIVSSYTFRDSFMLKAEGKTSFGQVDYKNSGTMNDVDDVLLELRGLGGYGFPVLKATLLTPYLGLGYRYLNDDSSGMTTSTGAAGYERESNYFYSPIGIETITDLDNGWFIGLTLEYDYFWKGIQKTHYSDANPAFNDLENDQNKGYGIRGSLKFRKESNEMDFLIEPYVRYWNIKKSEEDNLTYSGVIIGYGYEPKNNSTEIGVKLAVNF